MRYGYPLYPQRPARTIAVKPAVSFRHPAARAAGWALLVMTLTAFAVFGPG